MLTQKIRHPCFDNNGKNFARLHLPVAPACNIQCAYCDRQFCCTNESRPGVTSKVITPDEALKLVHQAKKQLDTLSVIGIAGPGDPLANPEATLNTLQMIRRDFPQIMLCLSTNGLVLPQYVDLLHKIKITHLTVTINAVDPQIGAKIYTRVGNLTSTEGATKILQQQLKGVRLASNLGIAVKVNAVLIPGINDHHFGEIACVAKEYGASLFNPIPLLPVKGTLFENLEQPNCETMEFARFLASDFLPVMRHCQRCRADAFGTLGQDISII